MPSIAEVLLPLGAGVASAMNPRVGRAVQGAIGTHLALRDQSAAREQAAQEAAAEEKRRQMIADMLSRGDPGNPYMAAAAELARAGAVDPALRMYSQGVGHQVQISDSAPQPGRTGSWRTDPRTGQQHYVLVDDATGKVVSSEAWGGEPEHAEKTPKLSRDTWTDAATGQEYVDFYDDGGDLVKRETRGGRKVMPDTGGVSTDGGASGRRADWLRQYENAAVRERELVREMEELAKVNRPVEMARRQNELRSVRGLREQAETVLRGGAPQRSMPIAATAVAPSDQPASAGPVSAPAVESAPVSDSDVQAAVAYLAGEQGGGGGSAADRFFDRTRGAVPKVVESIPPLQVLRGLGKGFKAIVGPITKMKQGREQKKGER